MSDWIVVVPGGRGPGGSKYQKYYDKSVVLVTPRGEILLTPCTASMLGYPTKVHIMYDPHAMKFGLMPASDNDRNYYVVQRRDGSKHDEKKSPMLRVASMKFCKSVGLISESHVFVLHAELDGDGILSVDMKQRREVVQYK